MTDGAPVSLPRNALEWGSSRGETIDSVALKGQPFAVFFGFTHYPEVCPTTLYEMSSTLAKLGEEAKDFKVVVALDIPEDLVRPGLSCTAKITTATRSHVLSIPIQALTIRQKGQLEPRKPGQKQPNEPMDPVAQKAAKEELQGVFVVNNGKAEFRKVATGITGLTEIEVLNGLKEDDQIVTGSYQVIRTIRNDAKIKVDNKAPVMSSNPAEG